MSNHHVFAGQSVYSVVREGVSRTLTAPDVCTRTHSTLADRLDAVRAAELAAGVTHPSCAYRGCTSPATGRLRGVGLCACHEMAARQREVAA